MDIGGYRKIQLEGILVASVSGSDEVVKETI
jgi:hypothetical protein